MKVDDLYVEHKPHAETPKPMAERAVPLGQSF